MWMDPVTENPAVGDTEVWEFYNFTADAHPMHVHEVVFEVVNRQAIFVDETDRVSRCARLRATTARALGDRLQGYGHRLSRRGHPRRASSTRRASSSGTATSSSTRTTR